MLFNDWWEIYMKGLNAMIPGLLMIVVNVVVIQDWIRIKLGFKMINNQCFVSSLHLSQGCCKTLYCWMLLLIFARECWSKMLPWSAAVQTYCLRMKLKNVAFDCCPKVLPEIRPVKEQWEAGGWPQLWLFAGRDCQNVPRLHIVLTLAGIVSSGSMVRKWERGEARTWAGWSV